MPPLHQFSLYKCAFRDTRTTLLFIRFVERMRRAIAHEYGLPLGRVLPGQTFVAQFNGAQDKQGGLHSDESTHAVGQGRRPGRTTPPPSARRVPPGAQAAPTHPESAA